MLTREWSTLEDEVASEDTKEPSGDFVGGEGCPCCSSLTLIISSLGSEGRLYSEW